MDAAVPAAVASVFARWCEAGSPDQPGIAWPRDKWAADFPRHAERLGDLPDLLRRQDVRAAAQGAADDPGKAEFAFITVMAWGYGRRVGYGRHRTMATLDGTSDAAGKLLGVAQRLAGSGPRAAYKRLATGGDCRLRGLGPAFGTKFLYFAQPQPHDETALIFDSLVATWLLREVKIELASTLWSLRNYASYLDHMHQWARWLACRPDQLEFCIFHAMATERRSQWGEALT